MLPSRSLEQEIKAVSHWYARSKRLNQEIVPDSGRPESGSFMGKIEQAHKEGRHEGASMNRRCPLCWEAARAAQAKLDRLKREKAEREATQDSIFSELLPLPPIRGEKHLTFDVEEATKIRTEALEKWEKFITMHVKRAADDPKYHSKAEPRSVRWLTVEQPILEQWLADHVFNQTKAKFWRDNKYTDWVNRAQIELEATLRDARTIYDQEMRRS